LKKWIALLTIAIVVSNGYWIYNTVDNAVTLHYVEDSANFTAKKLEQAIRVANMNVIGISAEDAFDQLNPDVDGLAPFEKEGCIYAGLICLEFDGSRTVVRVR
jgi:hypothetical protein